MKRLFLLFLAMSLLLVAGCSQPMTKTQKGALTGTGIGAVAGAGLGQAIGGDTKATILGAAIGAAVGGAGGAAIGNYMDKQEAAMREALAGVEAANVQRNADLLSVTFKSDIFFDVDSSSLKAGSYDEISRVAGVLNQYPQTMIVISGHTDSQGEEVYNQQLSQRRADVVKNALTGEGVNPSRMTAIGFGEGKPIADNGTPSGRQLNRRVEITISPSR